MARFFARESCGKCYPCQMGTRARSRSSNACAPARRDPRSA
ncbi:NADH-ubiquinone oxidoreductase-F iron-sulfur binding region domain-containing protein [Candidatus Amarobacter glycogenicus]